MQNKNENSDDVSFVGWNEKSAPISTFDFRFIVFYFQPND